MKKAPLLNHYQTWLDDFTRINLWHGLCQQKIEHWHKLTITSGQQEDGSTSIIVIPQRLLQVIRTEQVVDYNIIPQLIKHIDYPLLPGVLFSECCRLGKRKLAEQLKMLFRLHTQPEMRHALILLCWCDFTTGSDLDEWYSLHLSNADELKQWISARQKTYRGLAALTKDYIDATRPL
ncbi:secretoglobin family protein [Pectobacterium parmentieri]|uniref:secretoglobin family protein n=1 Tax=Pectobacterium parmentieri TaxID=1905730 RepID=UPI0018DF7146|nr:secretoglobin family protein [Pectobacterium parmentieri]MBI0552208.1 secretoglobin family protein [Pectobacterium parmentieri]MBI0561266.1 secretoglobin family protein [Pectobacterium parmentieri]MBI0565471.1 secretoglobin family protein [Pectobacterium parmentieri]